MLVNKNLKNQREALDLLLTRGFWFIVLACLLYVLKGDLKLFVVMLCVTIILAVPVFYLHIEYLLLPGIDSITTKYQLGIFTVRGKIENSLYFDDIKQITVFATPGLYRGSVKYMVFEDYHFAEIQMKSGERFIVTCLMVFPISKFIMQFETVPIVYKKMFYPSILMRRLSW